MAENKINIRTLRDVGDAIRRETDRLVEVPPGCQPPGAGSLSVWVAGVPAPQGSKRALGAGRPGGRIRMIETAKGLKPWRAELVKGLRTVGVLDGAVVVKLVFVCPRPKATPKTRATPPKVTKPDVDKLARAVLDAMTLAGVIADDSYVTTLHAHKRMAELGEPTGAVIHLEPVQVATDDLRAGKGGGPIGCWKPVDL